MKLNLQGTAVIVGGAKGIGRAIALAFAAEGCAVAIADLDATVPAVADDVAARFGVPTLGRRVDATDQAAMTDWAAAVRDRLGGGAHLVYAAGVGSGQYGFPFWNVAVDRWEFVLRVNLTGAVIAAHAFREQLTAQGAGGSVLFISSIAGQIGSQTDPPYSAAKAGLINFAQCAAKDFAPFKVRVNTICPGMVQTDVNRSVWRAWCEQQPPNERRSYEDWAGEKARRVSPLGRWQTVDDVAALAAFLASPRAGNITGQTMNVDGGQVMHW